MHALWKKRPDLAAHIENVILHQDNAPCHTIRNTLLRNDVLGFKRAIHQPYSTDLPSLDFIDVPNMKLYLRGTQFIHRTKISHELKKATDH